MTRKRPQRERVEFGDWQTPSELARAVVELLHGQGRHFASVLEPTCGRGAFLAAARALYPTACLVGHDIDARHLEHTRALLGDHAVELTRADAFTVDWERVLRTLPAPLLILGNPPWVTSSRLGAIGGSNAPARENSRRLEGLDALTGRSNFDVSEWMLVRLLEAARGRSFELAMLCKSSVARRVLSTAGERGWKLTGELRAIDAARHFGVAVDTVLLRLWPTNSTGRADRWRLHASLADDTEREELAWIDGRLCRDVDALHATCSLEGASELEWRSGVKHDCADVFELVVDGNALVNGLGERVELEDATVYPFLKGTDLAQGRQIPRKTLLVTQHALREDTGELATRAPSTWSYLGRHAERLAARKSRIYRGLPPFSMFGIGRYTFAPYKVAVSGLHKEPVFRPLAPVAGKPVLLDDTCYFLPCKERANAEKIARLLNGPRARQFFDARVFRDQKRPVGKALLGALSLVELFREHGERFPEDEFDRRDSNGPVRRA